MYGKEGKQEKHLSHLEDAFAQLLRDMLPSCYLPQPMSPIHEILCIQTLLQYARTAYSSDLLDEMTDGMWKAILSKKPHISKDMLEKVHFVNSDPANFIIANMLRFYPLIMDLQFKLLVAAPGSEFITSDNPVVMYNQLMEFERSASWTGLASKGLQIFFPLSPAYMLFFYDPGVYACGPRRKVNHMIVSKDDISQLNALQVVSALENIYCAGPTANVFHTLRIGSKYRRVKKVCIIKGPEQINETGCSQLIRSSREDVRTKLKLEFIRILKPAKRWRELRKQPGLKPISVVRSPWLLNEHEKFSQLVDIGQYQPTEFLRYLNGMKEN